MKHPGTGRFSIAWPREEAVSALVFGAFALHVLLRVWSFRHARLLESRDSMSLIRDAKIFLSFDLRRIIDLPADTTPLYPFFTALFSLPGWSIETGARIAALFFSMVVFIAAAGIACRVASPLAQLTTLALLAVHPVLIALSRSVLTEPAYLGVVYLGLWLFVRQYKTPTWRSGLLQGGVFAGAFLARTEGLIFFGAVPILQALTTLARGPGEKWRAYARWAICFGAAFAMLSLPQIWRVSAKMGHLAINGRQVWELVLNNPDGKSYDQKIYGLDYSPQQINLEYIQSHPENLQAMASSVKAGDLARKLTENVVTFFRRTLLVVLGPFGMVFAVAGLWALGRNRRFLDLAWMLGFVGACLLAPFLHDVDVRHVAVVIPLLLLTAGIGVAELARHLAGLAVLERRATLVRLGLPALVVLGIVSGWLAPLRAAVVPPPFNREYAVHDYDELLAVLQREAPQDGRAPIRLAARRGYFAYIAGAENVFLPFTDYAGLVQYCRLNHVDFVFLEMDELAGFPFLNQLAPGGTPGFAPLCESRSDAGGTLRLYRFQSEGEQGGDRQVSDHAEETQNP